MQTPFRNLQAATQLLLSLSKRNRTFATFPIRHKPRFHMLPFRTSKLPDISAATRSDSIEFRASEDDAWYGVNLVLEGETLMVKFSDFPDDSSDERFRASDFGDSKALEDFTERFRPVSVQLQDHECRKVIEGKMVCVSQSCGENELKFFDAMIEMVCPAKHALENGTEVCTCTFVVFWQHGPNAGLTTSATIENICLIKHGSVETDPALSSFMELSRKKRDKDGSGRSAPKDGPCCTQSCGPYVNSDSSRSYKNSEEELQILEQPDTTMQTFIGKRSNGTKRMRQDTDLGGDSFSSEDLKGASRKYFILIENMEKDTSASMIVNFIYQETSTLCQALVLPSTLSEAHTRGAIFIENQEKFNRLSRLLCSPDHFIVSSRGRPWVITGNKWSLETFGSMTPKSEKILLKKNELVGKIKVVRKGTKEYENGKRLRDLFLEFYAHQQHLYKRLASEEQKFFQSHHTVEDTHYQKWVKN